jgi:TonB family protein
VLSLAQVREKGKSQKKGNIHRLELSENSRGKVLLAEVTLLFQFVAPPPVQPSPQLPPSVRGTLLTTMLLVLGIDLLWAMSSLASMGLGAVFLLVIGSVEFEELKPDVIPDAFVMYLPDKPKPLAKDLSLTKTKKAETKKVAEKAKVEAPEVSRPAVATRRKSKGGPAKTAPPCDAKCQAEKAEARRKKLLAEVSRTGALKILGTKGKGTGGIAGDLINPDGDPGQDAKKAFAGVGGLSTASAGRGGSGLKGKGGDGKGRRVGIGNLGSRVGGPDKVQTGTMVKEREPRAIVQPSKARIDGTLDSGGVARSIKRGMTAVRLCYQRGLKRDPKLTGKITLRLSISGMGTVASVAVESDSIDDAQVKSCITGAAKRWRFPPPQGGDAEIVVPLVFRSEN